ncbi:hypothetical protein D1007_12891 [Hordeum vulgare]|nr:hypothetical protein D1007_12891 [Hordeum vulgare]
MDDHLAVLARGEGWTEERHAAFLDGVERSFVQEVLVGAAGVSEERRASRRLCHRGPPPAGDRGQLPLDRPLPDSAVESNRRGPSRPSAGRGAK